jgi:hypothetical protein
MANNCLFDMKITGKAAAVKELVRMLQWKDEFKINGLGRVYEFICDTSEIDGNDDDEIVNIIGFGDCAWSVLCSMMKEYRVDCPSLESETERLGLVVEVYSSEIGMQFQEHILIAKGNLIISDCVDYEEHWIEEFDTLEEYNKEYETDFTEDMIDDNGNICIGGFGAQYGMFEDHMQYFN